MIDSKSFHINSFVNICDNFFNAGFSNNSFFWQLVNLMNKTLASCCRFNETGQELAHCEEKLELIERTLNSTQDELSSKSNDLNRERSNNQKLSVELKNAREQVATYEQELSDARNAIGR